MSGATKLLTAAVLILLMAAGASCSDLSDAETISYIHYSSNGGSGGPLLDSVACNSDKGSFTISNNIPVKSGYTFAYWSLQCFPSGVVSVPSAYPGAQLLYDLSITTQPSFTLVLTAVWTSGSERAVFGYNLVYNVNMGDSGPSADYGSSYTNTCGFTITDEAPLWEGHTFLFWSPVSYNTGQVTDRYYAGDTFTAVAPNFNNVLYAIWDDTGTEDTGTIRIDSVAVTLATSGYDYTYNLICSGATQYDTYWVLPSWMEASEDGRTISGTAPEVSHDTTYQCSVVVVDMDNHFDAQSFSINVVPDLASLRITSSDRIDLVSTQNMIYVPTCNLRYGMAYVVQGMPQWMTLHSAGYISGVAPVVSEDTDYTFTLSAEVGVYSDSREITVHVQKYRSDLIVPDPTAKPELPEFFSFEFLFEDLSVYDDVDVVIWDFGDGTSAVGFDVWHTYPRSGVYTMSCKFTNDYGTGFIEDYIIVQEELTLWDTFKLWISEHIGFIAVGLAFFGFVCWFTIPRIKTSSRRSSS